MIKEINKEEQRRYYICCLINTIILLGVIFSSLVMGQYKIAFSDVINILGNSIFHAGGALTGTEEKVIMLIRLPRTVAALMVGSALAVSGSVYQSTFNNQLVSPDVLGVSAGACVGAAIAILLGINSIGIGACAFMFGIFSVMLSLLLPKLFRSDKTVTLVLSGIIVGSMMNSIVGLIKFLADKEEKLAEITFWIMGALSGVGWTEIITILPAYIISMLGILLLRWKINILGLGEEEARSLGLNYALYRLLVIMFSTLLTASAVSISGNVGWIGLVIPHIGRAMVGGDNRRAIPIIMMIGASFMVFIDLMARNLSIDEIPLSVLTGIFGTIIYAIVLYRRGRELHE